MSNNTQPTEAKNKPRRKRTIGSIILFNSVILLVFSYNDGIKGLQETYDNLFKPSLSLTLSPNSNVRVGDTLMLNYEVPSEGYMSLWNWNGNGEIKVMEKPFELNVNNHIGRYEIVPTHSGMEHAILIWTEKASEQINKKSFDSDTAFNSALKLRGNAVHKTDISVQVYRMN